MEHTGSFPSQEPDSETALHGQVDGKPHRGWNPSSGLRGEKLCPGEGDGDRVLLTTDSMAGAGAPAGRYTLGDQEVEVRPGDRSARLLGTSRLAGSTLTMDQAITNVMRFTAVDLAAAIQMAAKNGSNLFPEIVREARSRRSGGPRAFRYMGRDLWLRSTWIGGERIWDGSDGLNRSIETE